MCTTTYPYTQTNARILSYNVTLGLICIFMYSIVCYKFIDSEGTDCQDTGTPSLKDSLYD